MRAYFLLPLLLTACVAQEGDIRYNPPPILADQTWRIEEQLTSVDGRDRICSIKGGEITVTQRNNNGMIDEQVSHSRRFDMGSIYKIIVARNVFETRDRWFNLRESQAIIGLFMQGGVAYTDLMELRSARHAPRYTHLTNKIRLDSFPEAFNECSRYIR